jgi:hypothetical protein
MNAGLSGRPPCRDEHQGYRCTLDLGHGGTYHEAEAGVGVVVRRWDRQVALPPIDCHGQYAAALAEHLRAMLDPELSAMQGIRDMAVAALAAWDAGEPFRVPGR